MDDLAKKEKEEPCRGGMNFIVAGGGAVSSDQEGCGK
jgi:hypothetical protein